MRHYGGWAIEWRTINGLIAPMTKPILTYLDVTIVSDSNDLQEREREREIKDKSKKTVQQGLL